MKTLEIQNLNDSVERGVAVLDRKRPGWWKKIKLTKLDMSSGMYDEAYGSCGCILAQLAPDGDYDTGVDRLTRAADKDEWATRRGFMAEPDFYAYLTRKWKQVIRERRATKEAA